MVPGDKVRVVYPFSMYRGMVGTIVRIDQPPDPRASRMVLVRLPAYPDPQRPGELIAPERDVVYFTEQLTEVRS